MNSLKDLLQPLQTNPAEALVFLVLAGAIVSGALLTITRRNPVSAVMSLVLTFFALAAMYATISAHFLAVLQVSVYAGAIMVLFIFVVMILNREEVEPVSFRGILTRGVGVLVSGYIFLVLARLTLSGRAQPILASAAAPDDPGYGTVATVGASLFRDFAFPFEAISLLLLVAVVGGVIVSRSTKQEEGAVEEARRQATVRAAVRTETRLGDPDGSHDQGHGGPGHSAAH